MKKMIRLTLSTFFVAVFAFAFLSHQAFADNSKNRSISIPTFKVQIEDMSVDSAYMEYPLIVYNDITYFPLTWNWCHKMGLSSGYTEKDGLYISKYRWNKEENVEKMDNGGYQPAGKRYTATVVDYPVFINGQKIDNQKEEYPLLNFRGITYFPLTWRFVVDEFAWYKSWDDVTGLKVSTHNDSEVRKDGVYKDIDYSVAGDYEDGNYVRKLYDDYAIIRKSIRNYTVRKNDSNSDEDYDYEEDWSANRQEELYKLNYKDDSFTKIASDKTSDTPYDSGKIRREDASKSFSKEGSKLLFKGTFIYDVANDTASQDPISTLYADKYEVNGLSVYFLRLSVQEPTPIPAPYTPYYHYVFVDKGDGIMHRINEWHIKTQFSAVYDNGKGGFYLCSPLFPFSTTRQSMERARVYDIDKNLKVDILNDKWKDWRNTEAIGTDKDHNLYLKNTWYAKDNPDGDDEEKQNLLSPINDGYYKLSPNGKLSKIYPYVDLESEFVTPNGEIYATSYDFEERGFFHIQKAKWVKP